MNIKEFSDQLQSLYEEMSETFSQFQTKTELPCLPSCTKCCENPEIETTPLEMIPMALEIYYSQDFEFIYDKLENSKQLPCIIMDGSKCSYYKTRPSICRMFGVAGYFDKNHQKTLSVCKLIKQTHPKQVEESIKKIDSSTPVMADWAQKLKTLNPSHDSERLPINQALKKALDKVALWSLIKDKSEDCS